MAKKEKTIINEEYLASKYDAEVLSAAENWIDGLSSMTGLADTWRVQRVIQALRIDKDGNLVKAPVRITRFAKGCPWALMNAAKDYLLSKAPYTGFIANGLDFGDKEVYKPVLTTWTRDDGDNQAKQGVENLNRHTLTQDLIDTTVEDMDAVKISENCTEETTADYYWDMPTPPSDDDVVSSVGVTVSVQGLQRQQDGTYNYTIVTKKALTLVGDEVTVECTAFGKSTLQTIYNLHKDGDVYVDENGEEVAIPAMTCGDPASGVPEVKIQPRQGEDCTWTLTIERQYANENVVARESSADELTGKQYTKTTVAVNKPEEHIKEHDAVKGVTYQLDTKKNPDGRYEQTLTEVTEKPCEVYSETIRSTVQGVMKTVTNKNMLTKAVAPEGKKIYTVENTRTKSGRYDQQISTTDIVDRENGKSCAKSVFEHQDTTMRVQSTEPSDHTSDAGDGKTYARTVQLNEQGSYDVTDKVTTEIAVDNAVVKYEKTLHGMVESVTDKNQVSALGSGGMTLGETRQSVKTDGGRWDNTVSKPSKESVGTIRTQCTNSDAVHQHTVVKNETTQGTVDSTSSGNVVITHGTSITNVGTWDNTTTTETYKPQTTVATSENATLKTVETTTTNSLNSTASVGVGSASVAPNSHGTFTERKVEHTPKPVKSGWHTWTSTVKQVNATYTYEHGILIFKNQSNLPSTAGRHNLNVSAALNEFGLLDGTLTYSDLKSWTTDSGSNGTFGGHQDGTITIYEPVYTLEEGTNGTELKCDSTKAFSFDVTVYYGRGNEGSEAEAAANNKLFAGLSLPSRTYLKRDASATVEGLLKLRMNNECAKVQYSYAVKAAKGGKK